MEWREHQEQATLAERATKTLAAELAEVQRQLRPTLVDDLAEAQQLVTQLRHTPVENQNTAEEELHAAARLAELKTAQAQLHQQLGEQRQLTARRMELADRLTRGQARHAEQTQQLVGLGPDTDLSALHSSVSEARTSVASWREHVTSWTAETVRLAAEQGRLSAVCAEQERAAALRADTQKELQEVGELETYLRKNRGRLASAIWDTLVQYASALVSSASEGRITRLMRDENSGDFLAEEDGRTVPVFELGGARRSICGLGLRVALAATFFGPGMPLLIDEAAADATDETAAAIAGMLSSLGRQVISVTHREGEAVNAGHVIQL
jgi:hypothetical protein